MDIKLKKLPGSSAETVSSINLRRLSITEKLNEAYHQWSADKKTSASNSKPFLQRKLSVPLLMTTFNQLSFFFPPLCTVSHRCSPDCVDVTQGRRISYTDLWHVFKSLIGVVAGCCLLVLKKKKTT